MHVSKTPRYTSMGNITDIVMVRYLVHGWSFFTPNCKGAATSGWPCYQRLAYVWVYNLATNALAQDKNWLHDISSGVLLVSVVALRNDD
jgi:hypothetical protein